jgi:hypothetical protein
MRIGKRGLALVAAMLVAAAASGAYATIPDGGGVIHGCYLNKVGTLRVIDTSQGQQCAAIETPIQWNKQGAPGVQGPKGDKGDPGQNGAGVTSAAIDAAHPDSNCPAGGSKFTTSSGVTYACNGTAATTSNNHTGQITVPTYTQPANANATRSFFGSIVGQGDVTATKSSVLTLLTAGTTIHGLVTAIDPVPSSADASIIASVFVEGSDGTTKRYYCNVSGNGVCDSWLNIDLGSVGDIPITVNSAVYFEFDVNQYGSIGPAPNYDWVYPTIPAWTVTYNWHE